MAAEEKLRRDNGVYRLFLIALKYIPVFITIAYLLNTILFWWDIDLPVLSNIAGMSLCTWMFMYIATYVFMFCTYHRLLLYYILIDDGISIYDYYFTIPLKDHYMLLVHTSLIGILVLALLVNHVKSNKGTSTEDNR